MTKEKAFEIVTNAVDERLYILKQQFKEIAYKHKAKGNKHFVEKGYDMANDEFHIKHGSMAYNAKSDLINAQYYIYKYGRIAVDFNYGIWYSLNRNDEFLSLCEKEKLFIYDMCGL